MYRYLKLPSQLIESKQWAPGSAMPPPHYPAKEHLSTKNTYALNKYMYNKERLNALGLFFQGKGNLREKRWSALKFCAKRRHTKLTWLWGKEAFALIRDGKSWNGWWKEAQEVYSWGVWRAQTQRLVDLPGFWDMTATDPETCCCWNPWLMNMNISPGGGCSSQGICQHRSCHRLQLQLPCFLRADALVSRPGPSAQAPTCTWFPVTPNFLFS